MSCIMTLFLRFFPVASILVSLFVMQVNQTLMAGSVTPVQPTAQQTPQPQLIAVALAPTTPQSTPSQPTPLAQQTQPQLPATVSPQQVKTVVTVPATLTANATPVVQPTPDGAIAADYQLVNANHELEACSTVPLSGGASLLGRDLTYGFNLIFNKAKQSGGINGVTVKLSTLDDHYITTDAEKNVQTLLQKSPLFFGNFGTESLLAVLPLIEQKKMAMFFPFTGTLRLRKPTYEYIIHYRASIAHEVTALTRYTVEKLFKRRIAVFYEDNRWGEEGLKAVQETLATLDVPLVAKASYPQNTVNILAAASDISKAKPTAIICIAQCRPAYNFIQNVLNSGMQSCAFLGVSELTPMQNLIKMSRGVTLVTSSLVPSPFKSDLLLVQQYRDDMKRFLSNVSISTFSLEGYISASIIAEAIKRTPPPITLSRFIKTIESFNNVDIGGLPLTFNPDSRSLSKKVWINTGPDNEWSVA